MVNHGVSPKEAIYQLSRSRTVSLRSYSKGPLCLRRSAWLHLVAAGKMKTYGVLPRCKEDWKILSPEVRSVLEQTFVGVFALSDLYQCHSPKDPDEWMHAVFQAGTSQRAGKIRVFTSLLKIAFTNPIQS